MHADVNFKPEALLPTTDQTRLMANEVWQQLISSALDPKDKKAEPVQGTQELVIDPLFPNDKTADISNNQELPLNNYLGVNPEHIAHEIVWSCAMDDDNESARQTQKMVDGAVEIAYRSGGKAAVQKLIGNINKILETAGARERLELGYTREGVLQATITDQETKPEVPPDLPQHKWGSSDTHKYGDITVTTYQFHEPKLNYPGGEVDFKNGQMPEVIGSDGKPLTCEKDPYNKNSVYNYKDANGKVVVTIDGVPPIMTLPDGTKVRLNASGDPASVTDKNGTEKEVAYIR